MKFIVRSGKVSYLLRWRLATPGPVPHHRFWTLRIAKFPAPCSQAFHLGGRLILFDSDCMSSSSRGFFYRPGNAMRSLSNPQFSPSFFFGDICPPPRRRRKPSQGPNKTQTKLSDQTPIETFRTFVPQLSAAGCFRLVYVHDVPSFPRPCKHPLPWFGKETFRPSHPASTPPPPRRTNP